MATIVFDDGHEEEFNQEDYISKSDLEENYISRDELEDNYVSREKYERKSKQAKQAFANQDKVKQEALEKEADAMASRIREEVSFTTKHGFDSIPEEIKAVRQQHPTLTWEQAYQISGYKEPVSDNPNPGREDIVDPKKTKYSFDELSELAVKNPKEYNVIAGKIESGEYEMF